MKTIIFPGVMLALAVSGALGAPRAQNAQECTVAADMAVVARALAEEKIAQSRAELLMRRIYKVDASPRGQEMMRAIISAAYAHKESASAFADALYLQCMASGGNLDPILGIGS